MSQFRRNSTGQSTAMAGATSGQQTGKEASGGKKDKKKKKEAQKRSKEERSSLQRQLNNATMQKLDEDIRLRLAASYINDSILGREFYIHPTNTHSMNAFAIINNWWYHHILIAVICTHLLLIFGEPTKTWSAAAPNDLVWVELVIVLIYIMDLSLRVTHAGFKGFTKKVWNLGYAVLVIINVLDVLVAVGSSSSVFRFSRFLRPLLLVARSRTTRRAYNTIAKTIPRLKDLALVILIFVIMYAVLGVQILRNQIKTNGETRPAENFDDFIASMLTLYTLLSLNTYPFVIYGAMNSNPGYAVFFITYVVIAVYFFLSQVVAVMFSAFKEERAKKATTHRVKERIAILAAFIILDVNRQGKIPRHYFLKLLDMIQPPNMDVIIWVFNYSHPDDEPISVLEFFELTDMLILNIQFDANDSDDTDDAERHLGHVKGDFMRYKVVPRLRKVMKHRYFKYVLVLLTCCSVLIVGQFRVNQTRAEVATLETLFFVLTMIYVVEIAARYIAFGNGLWKDPWQVFDVVLVMVSFLVQFLLFFDDVRAVIGGIQVFRSTVTMRFISLIKRLQEFVRTFRYVLQTLFSLGTLLLVVFYIYMIIGMELFSGTFDEINISNVSYSFVTFNTPWQTFILLFQMATKSNWQYIMYDTMAATQSRNASWYFVTFNMIVVLIITNLLTTLYVEAFNNFSNRETYEVRLPILGKELDAIRKEYNIQKPWWTSNEEQAARKRVYRLQLNETRWSRTVKVTPEQKLYEMNQISTKTGVDLLEMQRERQMRERALGNNQETVLQSILLRTGAINADDDQLPEIARKLKQSGQRHLTKKERKEQEKRNRTHSTVVTTMQVYVEDDDEESGRMTLSPSTRKKNNRSSKRISVSLSGGMEDLQASSRLEAVRKEIAEEDALRALESRKAQDDELNEEKKKKKVKAQGSSSSLEMDTLSPPSNGRVGQLQEEDVESEADLSEDEN